MVSILIFLPLWSALDYLLVGVDDVLLRQETEAPQLPEEHLCVYVIVLDLKEDHACPGWFLGPKQKEVIEK